MFTGGTIWLLTHGHMFSLAHSLGFALLKITWANLKRAFLCEVSRETMEGSVFGAPI